MEKKKSFNLRVDPKLISELKIQSIRENRPITAIAEELFREYLRKAKTKK
jgi:hypothetical protein